MPCPYTVWASTTGGGYWYYGRGAVPVGGRSSEEHDRVGGRSSWGPCELGDVPAGGRSSRGDVPAGKCEC